MPFIIGGIIATIALFCVGCTSTDYGVEQPVLDHQRKITELEATIRDLQGRINRYEIVLADSITGLESVTARTAGSINTVDEITELFGEYQREVARLLSNYRALQNTTASCNKVGNNTNPSIAY